jgi:hypothetical protein
VIEIWNNRTSLIFHTPTSIYLYILYILWRKKQDDAKKIGKTEEGKSEKRRIKV